MTVLFKEIIPSILQTKKDCLVDEKYYVPFVVNRALSFHYDCILYANQMNMSSHINSTMQYHFYLNTVRAYKRPFQKWEKRQTSEELDLVKEYFNYSNEKAKEALTVLSFDDIKEIKKILDKGGINHAKYRRVNMGDTS